MFTMVLPIIIDTIWILVPLNIKMPNLMTNETKLTDLSTIFSSRKSLYSQ